MIGALDKPLQGDAAVLAWNQLQHTSAEPRHVEALKQSRKCAVYRLEGIGPDGTTLIAKRSAATRARIEWTIYKQFLPHVPVPSVQCYGYREELEGKFWWLFLEEANGERYVPERSDHRALAGHWLGAMHRTSLDVELPASLPDRGLEHHRQLLCAARAELWERVDNPVLSADEVALLRSIAAECDVLDTQWEVLERECNSAPRVLVHGDFARKNLRVRDGAALLVFDWDKAGWGSPAIDLAQFVGHTASPDLVVYCSVFGQLDVRAIQRLADCGNLLRIVDKISWATACMTGDAYELLLRPLSMLRKYESQLAAALRAVDWGQDD
jgi:aminoglycoside phosphotransferase (APT) family kinase protein